MSTKCVRFCYGVIGFLIVCGIVLLPVKDLFLDPYMSHLKELKARGYSISYRIWKNPPVPMSLSVYLFNLTNAEDVKNGAIPVVKEVGPFVYREFHESTNITWNPNSTVTFMLKRSWYFMPERSAGTEDDLITTFNVVMLAAASMAERQSSFLEMAIIGLIEGVKEPLFTTKPVRQWLFEGMYDPLLNKIAKFQKSLNKTLLPFDKFGWFYQQNNSRKMEGVFNMFTGVEHLGEIERWNGENETHYYEPPCNTVNGSAGQLFPPHQKKTYISVFIPDVCRSLTVPFSSEFQKDGLGTYRYEGGKELFANATENPNNECFTKHPRPSGVADVSKCKFDIPAYISFPHFYLADESYRAAVKGMHPAKEKHSFFLDLDPITGSPLQVSAKLQINIQLKAVHMIHSMKKLPEVLMPFIWFHEHVLITPDLESKVRMVDMIPMIVMIVSITMIVIGFSLLLAVCFIAWRKRISQPNDEENKLVTEDEQENEAENGIQNENSNS